MRLTLLAALLMLACSDIMDAARLSNGVRMIGGEIVSKTVGVDTTSTDPRVTLLLTIKTPQDANLVMAVEEVTEWNVLRVGQTINVPARYGKHLAAGHRVGE